MSLADELARLEEMRSRGALSDDEFRRAKDRAIGGTGGTGGTGGASGTGGAAGDIPVVAAVNRLRRSRADRWIAGLCGGLAVITGVEAWVWRLIAAVLALFGGTGVLLYILLWIFVPEEN